jgi:hypothetical protein
MTSERPELHACLCFLALTRKEKATYLESPFPKQEFWWRLGEIETNNPLRVIALVTAEECAQRFQKEAADEALGGIFGVFELMACEDSSAEWTAPRHWIEEDAGSLGCLDVWDGLRQLALVALRDLQWPVEWPRLTCKDLLVAATGGRFVR